MKKPNQDRYVQPRTYQSAYYHLDNFAFDEGESLQYLTDIVGFTQDESVEYLRLLKEGTCEQPDDSRLKHVRHISKPELIRPLCGASSGISISFTQRWDPLDDIEKSCLLCVKKAIEIYDEDIKSMGLTPDMFRTAR